MAPPRASPPVFVYCPVCKGRFSRIHKCRLMYLRAKKGHILVKAHREPGPWIKHPKGTAYTYPFFSYERSTFGLSPRGPMDQFVDIKPATPLGSRDPDGHHDDKYLSSHPGDAGAAAALVSLSGDSASSVDHDE